VDSIPRILITPGEPAGIGPDITVQIAQLPWAAELIVVADPDLLLTRANTLSLPLTLIPADFSQPATLNQMGQLKILPVALNAPCQAGVLARENAGYVIKCLELATDYCLQKKAQALVTGPIQKSILNEANIPFSGHTEFLAAQCKVTDTIMFFVVNDVKVALVTTHLPLAQVSSAITGEKIIKMIRLLNAELKTKFSLAEPRILVCGLNPHAGENGYLGREEIDVIQPALAVLRAEGLNIVGPLPADTIFTEQVLKTADVIVAMYHDQALPVVKYIGFDNAVNVTLGLPIIRTSVDHGTALDKAGNGLANAGSLVAAIQLAIKLALTA
jgi:4-hydroxythreonine-4-phosphate dehydrogenase